MSAMDEILDAWTMYRPNVIWASSTTIQRVFEPKTRGRIRFNDSEVVEDNSVPDGILEFSPNGRVVLEDF